MGLKETISAPIHFLSFEERQNKIVKAILCKCLNHLSLIEKLAVK